MKAAFHPRGHCCRREQRERRQRQLQDSTCTDLNGMGRSTVSDLLLLLAASTAVRHGPHAFNAAHSRTATAPALSTVAISNRGVCDTVAAAMAPTPTARAQLVLTASRPSRTKVKCTCVLTIQHCAACPTRKLLAPLSSQWDRRVASPHVDATASY